ncbi:hypothetical protein [Rhodohalobacter mucosus]|uniref:Exo-alpha-sialidase n=1 Tax=Rhodohalobacter mucosus TaxID=2079485 RepID=A0A316TQP9_9BACT|nr:hypothetical protein [Rhodohalobacter mucosus]PWN06011.1 hypothetical protein DDZ15_12595 [Rhodohalobacter mucosus]
MKKHRAAYFLGVVLLFSLSFCSDDVLSPGHQLDYPGVDDVARDEALGVVWEEVSGNPVLEQPDCPQWNCLGATDPWISRGMDRDLLAWFSTGGSAGGPVVGRALVDENLQFQLSPEDGPVLALEDNRWNKHRETVSLYWDEIEQEWVMWYLGYENSFFEDPGFGQMRTSDPEGIVWPRSEEPIYRPAPDGWDHAFITGPTFIETPEGQWRLYFTGAGSTVGVGLLISDDRGKTWTPYPDNPVFERELNSWDQGILEQSVLYVDGQYMMWYSGYEEPLDLMNTPIYIGLALSEDGITWERSPYNPVVGPSAPGHWNDLRVVSPHVIRLDDGSLLMAAHGQGMDDPGRSMGRIGLWKSQIR